MSRRELAGALAVLIVGSVVAIFLGRRALDLRVQVDELELIPRASPVLAVDQELRETFGSDDRFVIGLESNRRAVTDPVFLDDLAFLVETLHENRNFGMLLHDRLGRPRFAAETPSEAPWLLQPPDAAWVERALDASVLVRRLAAGASRRTAFLETPSLSVSGVATLEERLEETMPRLDARRPGEYTLRLVGRDVVLNGLGHAIFDDLARLLPWTFGLMFLLLLAAFRSPALAGVALLEVGLAVASTLGVLAWVGLDLSIMTALVPVLITVLGIADEIHLFGELARLDAQRPDLRRIERVRRALGEVFFPITATTLTTAIGFASFLFTDVPALRAFGLAASVGVCFSWFFTVTFVPALLVLLPISGRATWAEGDSETSPETDARRPRPLRRRTAILVSILVIPGALGLRVDDGWTRNFDPRHRIVRDVTWFQAESVGLYSFDVLLRRADDRRWSEPELLRELATLAESLGDSPRVTAVFSIVDLVRDRAWELGDPAAPRPPLPASSTEVERLLGTFLDFNEQIFVDSFLDATHHAARLKVFTTGDDYETSSRVKALLRATLAERFGEGVFSDASDTGVVTARIGGSAERGRVLIEAIVESQARSIVALWLMAWITLGLASGRWRTAFRCVAVIAWALALVLGLAGWAGVALGVASSCFLALGLGVGLDYAIHLAFADEAGLVRVRRRVIANVAVVGLGLSVLLLSTNPTLIELGALVVLSMATCGWAVLVFFGEGNARAEAVDRT